MNNDKIEPKFKVGDWVVNKFGDSWHIDSLDKKNYQVSDGKGNYNYFPISKQDEIHLWAIQDAKDGDVIFYDEGWICIFKCIHGIWYSSYCFITDDGEFHTGYERHAVDSTIHGNAHPATKEQRDLLFQKIKEAGYEWDADKKELKKLVEPKFKVGDWVIFITSGSIYQVEKKENYEYTLRHILGSSLCLPFSNEVLIREWTIQDARDGDVLCCKSGWMCIFKAIDNHTNTFSSFCFMDRDKCFFSSGSEGHTLDKNFIKAYNGEIYPATKEQRDALMKAINDARYEWDAEKKKLNKKSKFGT